MEWRKTPENGKSWCIVQIYHTLMAQLSFYVTTLIGWAISETSDICSLVWACYASLVCHTKSIKNDDSFTLDIVGCNNSWALTSLTITIIYHILIAQLTFYEKSLLGCAIDSTTIKACPAAQICHIIIMQISHCSTTSLESQD